MDDADRFVTAMAQVTGKRLTYKEFTGKTTDWEAGLRPEPPSEPYGSRSRRQGRGRRKR